MAGLSKPFSTRDPDPQSLIYNLGNSVSYQNTKVAVSLSYDQYRGGKLLSHSSTIKIKVNF
jgi:hypothetical protein